MDALGALKARNHMKAAIRGFFVEKGYLEVDTPILVTCPGTEVYLEYFETEWRDFRRQAHRQYLRSSPELHMKQVLALGAEKIFQLAPCFRNGGELSDWHAPEFTMLEWYESGISYPAFMDQTWELLTATKGNLKLPSVPKRFTVAEAIEEFAGVAIQDLDPDFARQLAESGMASVFPEDDFDTALGKVLIEVVEPAFARMGAVILSDYPASQAALSQVEGKVARRFEVYIDGIEICNAFKEELSAEKNRQRYAATMERRRQLGLALPEVDEDFLQALAKGVAPACGNALGFDRWLALVNGAKKIDRFVPFKERRPFQLG